MRIFFDFLFIRLIYQASARICFINNLLFYLCLLIVKLPLYLLFYVNESQLLIECLGLLLIAIIPMEYGVYKFLLLLRRHLDNKDNLLSMLTIILIFMQFIFSYLLRVDMLIRLPIIMFIVFMMAIITLILGMDLYIQSKEGISMEDYKALKDKYNKISYDYRLMRHNLVNNLLGIKSSDAHKTKEMINLMMRKFKLNYEISPLIKMKGTGIIGIINAKLSLAECQNVFVDLNYDDSIDDINTLDAHKYLEICEAIGIVLDNAIEAATHSKARVISVDIHRQDKIIIKISNSFNSELDLDKLGMLNYSTKERESGLGLSYLTSCNIKCDFFIQSDSFITYLFV